MTARVLIGAAAGLLVLACATPRQATRAPETISGYVPDSGTGLDAAVEVHPRDRETIFEQINGGSASFLANGMFEAVFATFPRSGGGEYEVVELEVYRFADSPGALVQFGHLHGTDGKPWKSAQLAVLHEYGVEVLKSDVIIRATFNDGPAQAMRESAEALVERVLRRVP